MLQIHISIMSVISKCFKSKAGSSDVTQKSRSFICLSGAKPEVGHARHFKVYKELTHGYMRGLV